MVPNGISEVATVAITDAVANPFDRARSVASDARASMALAGRRRTLAISRWRAAQPPRR